MGLAGRKRFEEDFTWETVIERHWRPLLSARVVTDTIMVESANWGGTTSIRRTGPERVRHDNRRLVRSTGGVETMGEDRILLRVLAEGSEVGYEVSSDVSLTSRRAESPSADSPMDIRRVALIFDDRPRPETTGVYCRRALESPGRGRAFPARRAGGDPHAGVRPLSQHR